MNRDESNVDWLFEHARNLNPDQQHAFLNAECQDEQLRAEVAELLEHHRKLPTDSFVNPMLKGDAVVEAYEAAAAVHDDATNGEPVSEFFIRRGTRIGKYKIMELLGEGGMGSVFVAEQKEPVARRVALKVIKTGGDSKDTLARFEAERQALSMMDHPNIAKILDAGSTDTGRPYFVMELVKGLAITDYCEQHKLDTQARLKLFVSVCQAVAHAHQKGIIHRDIKPSNVLIADYDDEPVVKVIDFGVAKATTQKLSEKTIYTRFGQLVGTFEYMSPEQAKLNQLDIDTRSDVYSLGVLLYELLTGVTPFDRERLRTAALNEMVRIICEEAPPKPSTRLTASSKDTSAVSVRNAEPLQLAKIVRGELDWIVMRSLEKERKRRYQSATAFAEDIQRFLDGDVVDACPPTLLYRTKMFVRRNRTSVAIGAVLLVSLVATAIAGWISANALSDKYSTLQQESRIQDAIRLAALSEASKEVRPDESMRQAIQAVEKTIDSREGVVEIAKQRLLDSFGRLGGEVLYRQEGRVRSTEISSDSQSLVISGGTLLVRSLLDFNAPPALLSHQAATRGKISQDGRWLVSAGHDGVMLWNFSGLQTRDAGVRLAGTDEDRKQVTGLVISGNGRWAAVCYYGGHIHVWDLQADDPKASERIILEHVEGTMFGGIAINHDGSRFLTACGDGKIFLWNLNESTLTPKRDFSNGTKAPARIAISTDGRWVVISSSGISQLWDLYAPDQEPVSLFGQATRDVEFTGDYLAVGGSPCFLYDLASDDLLGSCIALNVSGSPPVLSPNKKWFVNWSGSVVRLWSTDWLSSHPLPTLIDADDSRYRIWTPEKHVGSTISLHGHDDRGASLGFSPDGHYMVSSGWDGIVRRWRLDDANPAGNNSFIAQGTIQCVKVSPDGKCLVVGRQGASRLWKLRPDGGLTAALTLKDAPDGIGKIEFSPDGRWLASTSTVPTFRDEFGFMRNEKVVHVWDLKSMDDGGQAFELPHGDAVTSLKFDGSGRRLVTGCLDGIMRVWSMDEEPETRLIAEYSSLEQQTEEEKHRPLLEAEAAKQMIVAVTKDGSIAVSGTRRGQILVWDLRRRTLLRKLKGMKACPLDVGISPDGRWVTAGGAYEKSFVWDLQSDLPE